MPRVGAAVLKARYIWGPQFGYPSESGAFAVAGRVGLMPVDVRWTIIVDRIIYQVGTTSAGSVRAGIYREGATADSPAGAALAVESASVAQSAAQCVQMITIADTILTPGQYFVGLEASDVTGTLYHSVDFASVLYWRYDRAGGYGALTDPCPTVTAWTWMSFLGLRVKENLPAGYRL